MQKTIGSDISSCFLCKPDNKIGIQLVICLVEKNLLSSISALGDMMGNIQPRDPGHCLVLCKMSEARTNSIRD